MLLSIWQRSWDRRLKAKGLNSSNYWEPLFLKDQLEKRVRWIRRVRFGETGMWYINIHTVSGNIFYTKAKYTWIVEHCTPLYLECRARGVCVCRERKRKEGRREGKRGWNWETGAPVAWPLKLLLPVTVTAHWSLLGQDWSWNQSTLHFVFDSGLL